jgi:hypothetical protein
MVSQIPAGRWNEPLTFMARFFVCEDTGSV